MYSKIYSVDDYSDKCKESKVIPFLNRMHVSGGNYKIKNLFNLRKAYFTN